MHLPSLNCSTSKTLEGVPERWRDALTDHSTTTKSAAGWTVTEEDIGSKEVGFKQVRDTLHFDDYVYRRFAKGNMAFTVYAAYWGPGTMPTRCVLVPFG